MIFQSYALWPHMKVFDEQRYTNLTLPLKIRKWSREKIGEFLRPLAQKLGIEESFFSGARRNFPVVSNSGLLWAEPWPLRLGSC